jgi:hypothetical protein
MVSVPESVPLEGNEYVPETSNVFAFATPKLNAIAHNTLASALLLSFNGSSPLSTENVVSPLARALELQFQ